MRQLQRREGVVALSDAQRNGFAGIPFLLLRPAVIRSLPAGRRQDAALLVLEVDAGNLAEAEGLHEVMHGVDAEVVGQMIVIGVARLHDGLVHVDRAVAAFLVVAKTVIAEVEVAGVADGGRRRAPAQFQRGQGHEGLVGGARRIAARQRPVDQRLVGRGVEFVPALLVDALDEQVGVEGRHRHIGQHVAGRRLDGDQRAAAVAEGLLDHFLQFDIDRQDQVGTRRGRLARQRAHRAAASRYFHFLVAGLAVQLRLVTFLDAFLADIAGAAIVGGVVGVLDLRRFALADAADVADHMRGHRAQRILAEQARLDVDAGKAEALRGEPGDLVVRQPGADRQAFEVLGLLQLAPEAPFVPGLDIDDTLQRIDHLVEVAANLGRRDFQRIGREIARQDDAVAVHDQAAVGDYRHDRNAVVLGLGGVMVVLVSLQPDEARDQQAEENQDEHAGHRKPQPEVMQFPFSVLEFSHACAIPAQCVTSGWMSDGPGFITVDRPSLRGQQHPGYQRPHRGADQARCEVVPTGELAADQGLYQHLHHLHHHQ